MKSKTNMNLLAKIRSVTKDDDNLPRYSYSGLSLLKQCPYEFNLRYIEGKRSTETTLPLQLGTLLHYVLEQKGKMLRTGSVDYNELNNILHNGTTVTDDKTQEAIIGLDELKKIYWESWGITDSEGRTYNDKLELFEDVLHTEMESDDWKPVLFEHPFEFVYDDKIVLHGFIDRVDMKNGEYRVVDYKTNKKLFDPKDLPTSMQFGIYAMAILNEFGVLPVEFQYRMILIDKCQYALTTGWEKRLIKVIDDLIKILEESKMTGIWTPKPTPLCHWCNYCKTNPDANDYKNECIYHSLWTPNNKTYEVYTTFEDKKVNSKTKYPTNNTGQSGRKVIF